MPQRPEPEAVPVCRICTLRLELVCDRRAWWFRSFRRSLRVGIRVFAFAYRLDPDAHPPRAACCHRCLRFRKNALKERSRLFAWLDAYLNPIFNRARDARRFEDPAATDQGAQA